MIVKFPIATAQGGHKSKQFSSEQSRNVIMIASETSGKIAVEGFPGLKLVSSGSGADRGDTVMAEVRYVINGSALYKESVSGARTNLGAVGGSDRAIFANDGTNLYFTANNLLYKYDGAALTTISQSVVTNPSSIAYINRTFIITGDNGLFATSNAGDGDTYNALNYAEAETRPDPLLRAYEYSQLIYMAGSKTIELHRYSGTGNPPTTRQDTALVNVGIAGKHAITNTDQYLYFLGDDRKAYRCVGASYKAINTSGISYIIESMADASDCIASSVDIQGQSFVLFKFPSSGETLIYSEQNNYWTQLSSGTDKDATESWYGNSVTRCYEKNLVTDYRNGNTYELDADTYTDNGDTVLHVIVPSSFNAESIGGYGRIITKQMFINMQVGVGLASGQGSDPVFICQYSNDGGMTYAGDAWVDIGIAGDHTKRVQFDGFANGYEVRTRIMWSDPVPVTIWGGEIDIVPGGY